MVALLLKIKTFGTFISNITYEQCMYTCIANTNHIYNTHLNHAYKKVEYIMLIRHTIIDIDVD